MPRVTINVNRDQRTRQTTHAQALEAARRLGYRTNDEDGIYHPNLTKADTTTAGATNPPGMQQSLVATFPLEGKYVYTPITTPGGQVIYRRDMQSKADPQAEPEVAGGPYQTDAGEYLWSDVTSTHFRLWRTSGPALQLGDYKSSRSAGDNMSVVRDWVSTMKARKMRSADNEREPDWDKRAIRNALESQAESQERLARGRDAKPRARSTDAASGTSPESWENGGGKYAGETEGGVGAESWVGGKKNTTGYVIHSGDAAARPGLVAGRAAARVAAKRVGILEAINAANRKAWG